MRSSAKSKDTVPVIDREGRRRALQASLMDDRMIEGPPMAPPPAPRTQPPKKDERPTPWRVEGEREPTGGDGGSRRRMSGPPFGRRWIYLILALLAFNILFAQLFTPRTTRVDVPYTFFLDQVDAGNVAEGRRARRADPGPVQEGGQPEQGREGRQGLRDGPADLRLRRRPLHAAAGEGRGGRRREPGRRAGHAGDALHLLRARRCCSSGSSSSSRGAAAAARRRRRPRRPRPLARQALRADRPSARRSTTSRASTRPRRSSSRSSTSSRTRTSYRALGGGDPQGRPARPGRPAPARRCWRAPSPARPTCRSSRSRASEFIEMVVGVGASPRARPVRPGQEGRAGDHLHRRARRDRPPARRRRVARRPRRARADAEPDPHRDGRLHGLGGRHRPRGDQPARGPRLRAAAPRPLRPPRLRQPARRGGPREDPRRSTRARCRWPTTSTSSAIAVHDARHGRRRPAQPRQRGGADGRPARPRRASSSADFTDALEQIVLGAERRITLSPRGARAHRLPRGRPRAARHARARRRPGAQGLDRPARARARRHVPVAREPTATATTTATCAAASSARSAAARRRRSSTATSRPAPSPTSSRSRTSRARWSGRWGMSETIGLVSVLPGPGDEPTLFPGDRPAARRRRRAEIVDAEVRAHRRGVLRARRATAATRTASGSTALAARAAGAARRSTRTTPTALRASTARRRRRWSSHAPSRSIRPRRPRRAARGQGRHATAPRRQARDRDAAAGAHRDDRGGRAATDAGRPAQLLATEHPALRRRRLAPRDVG